MLKTYLKIVVRRLRKDRANTLINLFGLTVGLGVALLIGMYVLTEWQTDRAFPEPERTYRVLRVSDINGDSYDIGVTSAPFATAMVQDFPSNIESFVRVYPGQSLVEVGEDRYREDDYYYVDPQFFSFFGYSLLYGNPETALVNPHTVVLTHRTALRYFGGAEEAMGKTLRIDNEYDALVTGVLAHQKYATHLEFDLLESIQTLASSDQWTEWWNNNLCTYLRLNPGVDAGHFEAQLPAFMDKYFGADFERTGRRLDLRLQPLTDVYFEADTRYDPMRHGSLPAMRIFVIATLLLMVIALFNYVNLSTAKTIERGVEVGIYKALGSNKKQIIGQVFGETLMLTVLSLGLAGLVTWAAKDWFEQFFEVSLNPALSFASFAVLGMGLVLLMTLLAGLYPGLLLASHQPALALKGLSASGERSTPGIRRVLVVFQFALSIGLLACTFIIRQQLDYLSEKNLGFEKEHVVLIQANNPDLYAQRQTFKERLLREPGVRDVTVSRGYPGGFHDASTIEVAGIPGTTRMRTAFVDFDYVETFGLEIIAGRNFSSEFSSDSSGAAMLNERAVAELGLSIEEVLNLQINNPLFDPEPRVVVGVVSDYHFSSLHDTIEPLIISTAFRGRDIAIKVDAEHLQDVIGTAESMWNTHSPVYPFNYGFLDDRIEQLYSNEQRQNRLFSLFAFIAILIASLGMLGLAAFAVSKRTKEIGIRKVLGASLKDVVVLLSGSFLIQVLIASLIAIPVAFLFLSRWLDGFAYHVEMGVWMYLLAGVIAFLVAGLIVGIQASRAALSNPVDALRYE